MNNQWIAWNQVHFSDGFWQQRQEIARVNTSRAIYDRFAETGRIDAIKLTWKEGMPNKPHVFWDSDVAKWMEGTACFLALHDDPDLRARLEGVIDDILRGQTADGYFNSAYLTLRPDKRFTDRTEHELYTAGHLIESAVAHAQATGESRYLEAMERFADLIGKVFVQDHSAPYYTPGHQELELALVRLYRATGKQKYLELARHFVNERGQHSCDRVFSVPNGVAPANPPLANQLYYDDTYAQDAAPARELSKAGGHAVRAMYYYSAMADLALEDGDEGLAAACERLWTDSVQRKMYVTGGVSAERYGEAIGTDYVLPNDLAYAETCASVAMANFSMRMFQLNQSSKYADMIELQMYNGALAGLSLDGKTFFYDNALQCRVRVSDFFADIHAKPLYPPYQRQDLFECSCCPPNVYRFLAELGQYFYSVADSTLFVHQYGAGAGELKVGESSMRVEQTTDYPWDGAVRLTLHADRPASIRLALRLPGWCDSFSLTLNDKPAQATNVNGYLMLDGVCADGDTICFVMDMPIRQLYPHPDIVEAAGRVALKRGPIVYCVEQADNSDQDLFRLVLPASDCQLETVPVSILGESMIALRGDAYSVQADETALYSARKPQCQPASFVAIPYFAWANRGGNDMTVWIRKQW